MAALGTRICPNEPRWILLFFPCAPRFLFVIPEGNLLLSFSLVILAQPESLYWPLPYLSFRSAAEESASVFACHPERSLARTCAKRSRRTCGCLFCAVILNAVKDPCICPFCLSFPKGICFYSFRL
jgi:hypothetical protein